MRILFSLMSNFEVFVASFCPIGGLWLLFFNILLSLPARLPSGMRRLGGGLFRHVASLS